MTKKSSKQFKSVPTESKLQKFQINGISCSSCINLIEKNTLSIKGVKTAHVNFVESSLSVSGNFTNEEVIKKLSAISYQATVSNDELLSIQQQQKQAKKNFHSLLIKSAIALSLGAGLMFYGIVWGMALPTNNLEKLSWILVAITSLLVICYCGGHFYKNAWKSLLNLHTKMDSLIALGTAMAWIYSAWVLFLPETLPVESRHFYFESAIMIIGLVNLGLAIETKSKAKIFNEMTNLLNLQPKMARLVAGNISKLIPLAEVKQGDILRVKPSEKIPVDAKIISGSSYLNEAMLSGESMPILKKKGDRVFGGSFNEQGSLLIKVENIGENTVLAQIIKLVQKAQSSKAPISRLVDKISSIFVPIVLVLALAVGFFWYLWAPEQKLIFALITSISVLMIACPCALGLATPISLMLSIGKAAQAGILIQDGSAFQKASKISTIVLDKTGTLTTGKPKIVHFVNNQQKLTLEKLFQIAASLEQYSEHPLALAFMDLTKKKKINLKNINNFQSQSGYGVTGNLGTSLFYLGNQKFITKLGLNCNKIQFPNKFKSATRVFFASKTNKKTELLGSFLIEDTIRIDSVATIKQLQQNKIKVRLLSGDSQEVVKEFCKKVNINNFESELSPQNKAQRIKKLQQQGEIIAMVGDGINDAPALAQADIGFAVASGTDIAIETADIVLMNNSLKNIPKTILIAKIGLKNIKQNLAAAFAYNIICIPIAAGVLYPLTGILLNPIIAAVAMSLSSITVVFNAARIRFFKF